MDLIDRLWDESTNETVRQTLEPTVPFFEIVTHLGDGALLVVLGVLLYWFGARDRRRDRLFVIAIGLSALALSAGLKGIFELPRPDVAFAPAGYPGYTFPSAHAMGAAAVYGALAATMDLGRARTRYAIAGVLIGLVALSRVVIGVHFAGDVIVGLVLGLGLVAAGQWLSSTERFDPGATFALAAVIAVSAFALGSRVFVSLTLGASLGGLAGWYLFKDRTTSNSAAAVLAIGVFALIALGLLRAVSLSLGVTIPDLLFSGAGVAIEAAGYALLTAFLIAVPVLAVAVEDDPRLRQLQRRLPFEGRQLNPDDLSPEND